MVVQQSGLIRPFIRGICVSLIVAGAMRAQEPAASDKAPTDQATALAPAQAAPVAAKDSDKAKEKKRSAPYSGPNTVVELAPTPMLDAEGKQRLDPDGKPMFNPPVKQIRDKKGHPVFDGDGKPVFQTATDLGYDENGKKIRVKKEKPPKATPVSIASGTLTVDGWTGKARLNYDIADFKYMYVYVPGIGVTIVSQSAFPGAKEQAGAFNDKTLHVTVEGHPIELTSDKRLLGKKPESAWVAVDRGFLLPSKFPVFGYGPVTKAPYVWPGSKQSVEAGAEAEAPPLPVDVRPAVQLAPCPAGTMRKPGPPVLPGQTAAEQPCVPIPAATAGTPASSSPAK